MYGLQFIGTENEGVRLLFAGHKFPDFEIKSVVEISCISTVLLSFILLKKIKYLSLSDWFSPWGFFHGLFGQKSLSQIYGVTVYLFSAC